MKQSEYASAAIWFCHAVIARITVRTFNEMSTLCEMSLACQLRCSLDDIEQQAKQVADQVLSAIQIKHQQAALGLQAVGNYQSVGALCIQMRSAASCTRHLCIVNVSHAAKPSCLTHLADDIQDRVAHLEGRRIGICQAPEDPHEQAKDALYPSIAWLTSVLEERPRKIQGRLHCI